MTYINTIEDELELKPKRFFPCNLDVRETVSDCNALETWTDKPNTEIKYG